MRMLCAAATTIVLASGCGGGSGGDPDAAGSGVDAYGAGPPITAPDETWTFIPFPESRCMNDSSTGIGVNLNPDSRRVLIYLEGGGACFNGFTCAGVAHQNGFSEAAFNQVIGSYGDLGVFDRDDADNPFRDWSYVFIPYCTGDIHAGLNETGFGGRMMVGYRNIGIYLERLSPTFPDAELVMLTGSSAGGFGAAYNYDRVAQVFGGRPVVMLDDSGPPLSDMYLNPCLQQTLRTLWGLDATLPADCATCRQPNGGGLINLVTHSAEKYPDRRKGLITSTRDGTIRLFYGFGYPDCSSTALMPETVFEAGVTELVTQIMGPHESAKAFVIDSGVHVWLLDPLGSVTSAGVSLSDWIRDMLDTSGSWSTVLPP